MIQMPTRIAITFQSTSWAASTSVMVPIQIMTTTPSSATTVASSLLMTTAAIVIRKHDQRQPLQRIHETPPSVISVIWVGGSSTRFLCGASGFHPRIASITKKPTT